MPNNLNSPIVFLTNRHYASINDELAGGAGTSGTGAAPYLGQVGQKWEIDGEAAAEASPTATPLYAGEYQYVLRDSEDATTVVRGNIAFWSDAIAYKVTGTFGGCIAGVFLGANPTAGKYGVIQTSGIESCLFQASVTKATPAACDLVLVVSENSKGVLDILADATQPTWTQVNHIFGRTYEAPTGGAASRVEAFQWFRNV